MSEGTSAAARPNPVVTGIGVVAPNGLDTEAYWSATLNGKSGVDRIRSFDASHYPVTVAAELAGFDAAELVPSRLVAETATMSHIAFVAAQLALADAGLDPATLPEYEAGVVTANATGGVEFGQRELQNLWSQGPDHVSAYMSIAWFYAATTGQLSIRHKLRGHCGVVVSEQAGGLDAIGHARRVLRRGHRMVLAGGSESAMSPAGIVSQLPTRHLSTRTEPDRAYLPFDVEAGGFVPGEGGAILVLEEAEAARARGRPDGYGQVTGYAATFDPRPGRGRSPALTRVAELALADAGILPDDVDVVFADAYGVTELDRQEAETLITLFGPYGVPVTAPKTMTGRINAGAGALDVATALLTIREGVIPPTVGVTKLASGCEIDLVRGRARSADLTNALVLARGHGGFNAAVVVCGTPRGQ
jgi:act minimal PKS chain-length factor (CLF/KS beta)